MSVSPAPVREQPLLPGEAPGRAPRPAWRSTITRLDVKITPYFLIAPFFVLFGVFGLYPLLYNFWISLHWNVIDEPDKQGWSGFANYSKVFADEEMWNALKNTFGLFLLSSIPQLIIALLLAAVLNRKLRFNTFFRMGVLLPYVTPIVASTLVFGAVFSTQGGIVNSIIHQEIDWRADIWSSWIAVITMVDWRWTGYWALIFLAAMQAIPKDLYEAATVDGAKVWTQFWRITVPLLRPTILFAVIVSTIGGLQLFTEPLFFDEGKATDANGGSDQQFQTIGMYIYKISWKLYNLGSGAAASVALFLLIVLITAMNAWLTNRIARGGRK